MFDPAEDGHLVLDHVLLEIRIRVEWKYVILVYTKQKKNVSVITEIMCCTELKE